MHTMKIRDMIRDLKERGFDHKSHKSFHIFQQDDTRIRIPKSRGNGDASAALYSQYLALSKPSHVTNGGGKPVVKKPTIALHHFKPSSSVREYWTEAGSFVSLNQQMAPAARRRAWAIDIIRADPSLTIRASGEQVKERDGAKTVNPTTMILLRHAVCDLIAKDRLPILTQKTLDRAGHLQLTKMEKKLVRDGKDLEPLLATSLLDGYGRIVAMAPEPETVEEPETVIDVEQAIEAEFTPPPVTVPEPVAVALKEVESVMPELKDRPADEPPKQDRSEFHEALTLLFDVVWRTMPEAESCTIDFDGQGVRVKMKAPVVPNFDNIKVEFVND